MANLFGRFVRTTDLNHVAALLLTVVLAALIGLASPATAFAQAGPLGKPPEKSVGPQCPVGSIFVRGECIRPEISPRCPPGTAGAYPNCRPIIRSFCPDGTTGISPNCRPTVKLPPPLGAPRLQPQEQPRPRVFTPQEPQ